MNLELKSHPFRRSFFHSRILVILVIMILLLALGWAGIRWDSQGNKISEDVCAPSGGKLMNDSNGNKLNASAGQCAGGLSGSPSGSLLYHGVHRPKGIGETRVVYWKDVER